MDLVPTTVVVGAERVGGYPLAGLSAEWDNCPELRKRLRDDSCLFHVPDPANPAGSLKPPAGATIEKNIQTAKINSFVLLPALKKMYENDLKLPKIDEVIPQVAQVYSFNKIVLPEAVVYQDAWALRRLLHYIKAMLYRPNFPKDRGDQIDLHIYMHYGT